MGIGYGLRRLVAERARSAREAVEIAGALIEEFGYTSGRSYQFCDKNEAWVFQIPTGRRYVAKRIPDDHVYMIPNNYTIHGGWISQTLSTRTATSPRIWWSMP